MARKRNQHQQPTKSTTLPEKDDTPPEKDDNNSRDILSSELLERLPDETKIAIVEAASFKGPIPPPSLFGQYEEVLPGSADRILALTENQQSHRHKCEMEVLNAKKSVARRGQWMGFGLGICGLVGCRRF